MTCGAAHNEANQETQNDCQLNPSPEEHSVPFCVSTAQSVAQKLQDFRSSLVAVKEGGMITGERKLRENLGELYGAVNGYSGRPTQSQIESTTVLQKKLDEAGAQFQSIAASQVPPLNTALQSKQLEPFKATSREDWDKKQK